MHRVERSAVAFSSVGRVFVACTTFTAGIAPFLNSSSWPSSFSSAGGVRRRRVGAPYRRSNSMSFSSSVSSSVSSPSDSSFLLASKNSMLPPTGGRSSAFSSMSDEALRFLEGRKGVPPILCQTMVKKIYLRKNEIFARGSSFLSLKRARVDTSVQTYTNTKIIYLRLKLLLF